MALDVATVDEQRVVSKGNCVRLKIRGHNRPYWPGSEGVFAGPLH